MSDLDQLKKRLSAAFEQPAQHDADGDTSGRDMFNLFRDAPNEDIGGSTEGAGDPQPLSLWIAGFGLLVCAIALSFGAREGNLMLAGAMLALAALFGAYHFVERMRLRRRQSLAALQREAQADRDWAAEERRALISTIHESFGDLAVVRDLQGRILETNATFRAVTGLADPSGMTCEEAGFSFESGSRPGRYMARIASADGDKIFTWVDAVIRQPETGALVTESVARDITEETRTSNAADEARRKAERESAAKSRLLATVAHDIRTPLTGLLGMADLLGKSRLGPDQRNFVAGLRQSGQVLSYLVEDLLDFATMEAGRFQLRPEPEAPRAMIEGIVEMLAPRAHFKGLEIASFIAPEVPEMVDVDAGRLRQVLFNVVGNAVKFTRRGGVSIVTTMDGENLRIAVSDTGPGMTPAEKERIFEEFIQVGSARSRSSGAGLGLAISARIVAAFGGAMEVESTRGVGSTFILSVPVIASTQAGESSIRLGTTRNTAALVLAPKGPAGEAIARTIEALGGVCRLFHSGFDLLENLSKGEIGGRRLTDVIVDHRLEDEFIGPASDQAEALKLRRIFLVNPEQRQARIAGPYDAWLIRPLREQSLVDVLGGRLRGLEKRGAVNDNRTLGLPADLLPATSRGRIFLGEDDPVNALLIRTALEKAGYSVHHASDFDTLADLVSGADGWRPDLLLTDLGMPGTTGRDIVAELRGRLDAAGHAHVPVVVISGETGEDVRQGALKRGAELYLTKPLPPADLVSAVEKSLDGRRKRREG